MYNGYFIERKICPVCKKNDSERLYKIPYVSDEMLHYLRSFYDPQGGIKDLTIFNDVNYELLHCHNCDLIFQKNIPSDKLMMLLYEEYIDPGIKRNEIKNSNKYSLDYFKGNAAEIECLIEKSKLPPADIKFLDYGMGWGLFGNMAKAYGCDVYGTELSQSRKEYAESNGIKVVQNIDLSMIKFDIINLSDVLEHIEDPLELVEYLLTCLNSSGIIRISVPFERNILKYIFAIDRLTFLNRKLNCVAPLEHINCFSPLTLKFLERKNNLINLGNIDVSRMKYNNLSYILKVKFFIKRNFLFHYYSVRSTNLVFQKK
jgi:2-polyprenyl-3-methyl-5-hydroxy-6-metoxy-1,4-benzoquinol methylase